MAATRQIDAEPTTSDAALPDGWHGDDYLSAIDWRFEQGGFAEFGPAKAWTRCKVALIDGEGMTPWQRVLTVADSDSGISVCAPPAEHPAINCDLSVLLDHGPVGEWIGMDARTNMVPGAGAMTQRILFGQARPPRGPGDADAGGVGAAARVVRNPFGRNGKPGAAPRCGRAGHRVSSPRCSIVDRHD